MCVRTQLETKQLLYFPTSMKIEAKTRYQQSKHHLVCLFISLRQQKILVPPQDNQKRLTKQIRHKRDRNQHF
jgi:hypothetical protein